MRRLIDPLAQRVDVGTHRLPQQPGQRVLVLHAIDAVEHRLQRRNALRLDRGLVQLRGLKVGHLARARSDRRGGRVGDELHHALMRALDEFVARVPALTASGDLGGPRATRRSRSRRSRRRVGCRCRRPLSCATAVDARLGHSATASHAAADKTVRFDRTLNMVVTSPVNGEATVGASTCAVAPRTDTIEAVSDIGPDQFSAGAGSGASCGRVRKRSRTDEQTRRRCPASRAHAADRPAVRDRAAFDAARHRWSRGSVPSRQRASRVARTAARAIACASPDRCRWPRPRSVSR